MTMLAIVVIIGMGLWQDVPRIAFPESSSGDILWGVWSACILLSGPIGDVQHWQRAELTGHGTAFYWGSFFFGLYMLLVLVMARFQFTTGMNIVLLLAVLCVTSSTIDSIAVAMHEISDRKVGTVVALLICSFWGVFAPCRHHRAVEQGGRVPRGVRAADSRYGCFGREKGGGGMAYLKNVLIGVDQLLNTLFRGWPDETLSSRCWRWHKDGVRHWPRRLVDTLFFWEKEHCRESYESEQLRRQMPPELRAEL